jgi:glucokinase
VNDSAAGDSRDLLPPLPRPRAFDPDALCLGVDLGGTSAKIGLVDGAGRVIARGQVATELDRTWQETLAAILAGVRATLGDAGYDLARASGVGFACAGFLDAGSGVLRSSPNLPAFVNVPLRDALHAALGRPVVVENDANAFAFAEWILGAARDAHHAVFVTLGTGVGGGLVLNGALHRGAHGYAGEIGHTQYAPGGPLCACGRLGCVEAYLGSARLLARARELRGEGGTAVRGRTDAPSSVAGLAREAERGDAIAREVFAEAGEVLGSALANLVNLLDVECVVIGGGVSGAGAPLFDAVRDALRRRAVTADGAATPVRRAALGADAGMIGAAILALATSTLVGAAST